MRYIKHTFESCKAAAAGCSSFSEFRRKNPGACAAARYRGWLEDICARGPIQAPRSVHTEESIREIAKGFSTRRQMREAPGMQHAYKKAMKRGWQSALPPNSRDMLFVYILEAPAVGVYKVGISKDPVARAREATAAFGEELTVLATAWHRDSARVEQALLAVGGGPEVPLGHAGWGGETELRSWTPQELQQAMNILVQQPQPSLPEPWAGI